jgi:hypothetical protein
MEDAQPAVGVSPSMFSRGFPKSPVYAPITLAPWFIAATQDAEEFLQAAHSIRNLILAVTA